MTSWRRRKTEQLERTVGEREELETNASGDDLIEEKQLERSVEREELETNANEELKEEDDVTKEEQKGDEEMVKDFIINISTPAMQCNGELTMRRELY